MKTSLTKELTLVIGVDYIISVVDYIVIVGDYIINADD